MDERDELTRARVREWQLRRIEIKDQIQAHPERTLELSRVLDAMDDEHAAILAEAAQRSAAPADATSVTVESVSPVEPGVGGKAFELQLTVAAGNLEDLRRLVDMAVYEAQAQLERQPSNAPQTRCAGELSGTVGRYRFELGVNVEGGNG